MRTYFTRRRWAAAAALLGMTGSLWGAAELPRVFLKTEMSLTPSTGRIWEAPDTAAFQAVLTNPALALGDQIVLKAGARYVGNFTLPAVSRGSGWITIRTSLLGGISPEG